VEGGRLWHLPIVSESVRRRLGRPNPMA
jgi:hypothetical protein